MIIQIGDIFYNKDKDAFILIDKFSKMNFLLHSYYNDFFEKGDFLKLNYEDGRWNIDKILSKDEIEKFKIDKPELFI
jgi:hypothetical protein